MRRGRIILIIILSIIFSSCSKERTSTRTIPVIETPVLEIILEHIGNPADGILFKKSFVTDVDRGIDSEVIFASDVSRSAKIIAYNPVHVITGSKDLEGSRFIGAFAQQGFENLYIGTSVKANLFKYDLTMSMLHDLDIRFEFTDENGNNIVPDRITALSFGTDRKLYIGAAPGTHLFSYIPRTNSLSYVTTIDAEEYKITSILGSFGDKLYISTYPSAKIYEYNLMSEQLIKMTDYEIRGSFNNLTRIGERLLSTLYPAARLIVIDPYKREIEHEPESPESEFYIPSNFSKHIVPDGYDAYLGFIPSDYIYQYRTMSKDWDLKSKQYGNPFGVIDIRFFYCLDNNNEFYIIDKNKGRPSLKRRLYFLDGGEEINTLVKGPDGKLYGTCRNNPHLFSYDPDKDKFMDIGQFFYEGNDVSSIMTSGKSLYITFSDHPDILLYDPYKPWNPGNKENNNPHPVLSLEKETGIDRMIKGKDNSFYFTAYPNRNEIFKLDMSSGKPEIFSFYFYERKINTFKFNSEGNIIIGAEKGKDDTGARLTVINPENKQKLLDFIPAENTEEINCVFQSTNVIMYGAADSTFFIADIMNKKTIFENDPEYGEILDMTENSDGKLFALAEKNIVMLDKESNEFLPMGRREEPGFTDFFYKDPSGTIYIAAGKKLYRIAYR